jgi:hypothetical protein
MTDALEFPIRRILGSGTGGVFNCKQMLAAGGVDLTAQISEEVHGLS